jgi:hypothetical protein
MRESIGGTMLFWIVLFFMSVFIAFMASVIKYARVYKIKNTTINMIERAEGIKSPLQLKQILVSSGYSTKDDYVICKHAVPGRGVYYTLDLYATFSIPIVYFAFKVKISGETRLIETGDIAGDEADTDLMFGQSGSPVTCTTINGHNVCSASVNSSQAETTCRQGIVDDLA